MDLAWSEEEGKYITNHYDVNIDVFTQFIRGFQVVNQNVLQQFLNKQSKFTQLRRMKFFEVDFTKDKMKCMNEALSELEILRINSCDTDEGKNY